MAIRYLKIALLLCVSLQALVYAIQNVVNLGEAYGSFAYVMSHQDHVAYPGSIGPAITAPALIWFALIVVLACEFGTGFLAGKGTWDLWSRRTATTAEFEKAKTVGILGCGAAVVTWFALFLIVGSAWFQMWQTTIGDGSFRGAFIIVGSSALVMIFLNMPERE